jgi:transposase
MARRHYTLDFKVAAAKLVTEQGYGNKAAASSLGVPPSTIQHWVRRHGRPRAAAPAPPPDDPAALKAENDRLRDEVRRLTMEREILKKATAFFASERA